MLYSVEKTNSSLTGTIQLNRGLLYRLELNDFYINKLKEKEIILFNELLLTSSNKNVALSIAKKDWILFEREFIDIDFESEKF